jgi:hypothetical protein
MRAFGMLEADIFVNYFNARLIAADLGGPCGYCRASIPDFLPSKSILNVHFVAENNTAGLGMFIGGERGFHQITPPPANGYSRNLLFPRPGE